VFAIQDVICRFLANGCLQAGLRVPEDVALIGCGNEPLVCDHPEPAMSSVDAGHERVGYEAAALLNRLMDGEENPQGPLMIAPKELVVRHSTDACMLDDSLVATALKFIAEQCHKGIRGDDVAQHVHTAERSLRRRFLAATGHTMMEEIARLRLERAKRLLVESDEPVKQVALECSFSNAAYFHRVFVQNEGISPGDYRRQRGKHGQSHL
jgi:LacI family transcriptional regulator